MIGGLDVSVCLTAHGQVSSIRLTTGGIRDSRAGRGCASREVSRGYNVQKCRLWRCFEVAQLTATRSAVVWGSFDMNLGEVKQILWID